MTETELEYHFCFNCNDRKQCYTKPKDCTRIQEEIGLQEMTNEEYIQTCNTEQLAEWINNIVDDGIIKAWMIKNNCCGDYLESVKWWLKQPHHSKE